MASKYTRVLVHLRKVSPGPYEVAKFSECIFDHLGLSSNALVRCHLENNRLLLQPVHISDSNVEPCASIGSEYNSKSYKIMHPPFCPVHHLDEEGIASLPPEISTRGIDVGVAVILESSDGHLLLTRRAPHMRTFPSVWVPPGGHIEDGETLETAALRELEEETGLTITLADRESSSILGLWESVYPPILAMGPPKRHHAVVYMHITVSYSAEYLTSKFKLCPEEVDAAAWLPYELVKVAVWSPGENEIPEEIQKEEDVKEEIYMTLVNKEGEHASGVLDSSILRNRVPSPGLDIERISTGSRFALSLWLEKQATTDLGEATHKNLYKKFKIKEDQQMLLNGKNSISELKNKM